MEVDFMEHNQDAWTASNSMTEEHAYASGIGGIQVNPVPITVGDHVTIIYNGKLKSTKENQVYLHSGYGNANWWSDIKDLPMAWTGRGWEKTFQVSTGERLNFCFHNQGNEWDNNNGLNWSYTIHNGRRI